MNNLTRTVNPQYKRQQGMTMISMALILAMIAFIVLITLRLFPVYLENWKMNSHLEALALMSTASSMTDGEVVGALMKRFQIDDIERVKSENIFVERDKSGVMAIAVEYEVRTPGLGNVEMVVSFVNEVAVN